MEERKGMEEGKQQEGQERECTTNSGQEGIQWLQVLTRVGWCVYVKEMHSRVCFGENGGLKGGVLWNAKLRECWKFTALQTLLFSAQISFLNLIIKVEI